VHDVDPALFDAGHLLCRDSQPRENLQRTSGREIHPAHRIEVCRRDTIEACRVDDESVWVPLDRFVNSPEDEENGEGGGEE